MDGWVSFHRKIEEWEWYTDANTFRLFFHLVIKANHADGKWRGIEVKRGQHITSIDKLSDALSLSPKQIRTAMTKLKKTGEVATKGTNKYTLVTIVNYGLYQDIADRKGEQQGNQRAIKGQSKGNKQQKEQFNNENIDIVRKFFPGTKTKASAMKKLPKLIEKYGVDQMINTCKRYSDFVVEKRKTQPNLQYLNESTFWNGRYVDYLDENWTEEKQQVEPDMSWRKVEWVDK